MAAQIEVSGVLNPDDMDPEHVDLSHDTGLSQAGYEHYSMVFGNQMDDLDFRLVK